MALMKSLVSVIVANKIWVLGALAAGGIYFGAVYVTDKIESLTQQTSSLTKQLVESDKKIKALNTAYADLELKYSKYTENTFNNQKDLDERLDKLEAARGKENTVAAKPKLATKVAKQQVETYQERLACVSGNQQACSRLQSLSVGAQASGKTKSTSQ